MYEHLQVYARQCSIKVLVVTHRSAKSSPRLLDSLNPRDTPNLVTDTSRQKVVGPLEDPISARHGDVVLSAASSDCPDVFFVLQHSRTEKKTDVGNFVCERVTSQTKLARVDCNSLPTKGPKIESLKRFQ